MTSLNRAGCSRSPFNSKRWCDPSLLRSIASLFRVLLAVEREYRKTTLEQAQERFGGLGPWAHDVIQEVIPRVDTPRLEGSTSGDEPSLSSVASSPSFDATASLGNSGPRASAAVACEALSTLIGPYWIQEFIGSGGMGVVYKAKHTTIGRVVALKRINFAGMSNAWSQARFRNEGEALARLDHPNIPRLYEFDDDQGDPYFTMEWIDGPTLAKKFEAGPMELREAAELVRTLAETVEYLHEKSVLHRDLKPGNVMLDADGTAKVMDFGLAKLMDVDAMGLTPTDAAIGTPCYMSLEQAQGRTAEIDQKTDVYALGAILYEAVTGRPPFRGENKLETIRLICETEVVPPSHLRAEIPQDLDAVCLKCLERDRERRYSSARQVADDLEKWLKGERWEMIARPLGWSARVSRAVHRRAKTLSAIGVALLGVLTGFLLLSPSPIPRGNDPPGPTEEERRQQAIAAIQAKLNAGQKAVLIGATGAPPDYHWVIGGARSSAEVDDSGTFLLSSQGISLLSLLSGISVDRYELVANLRHDKSDWPGEVGVYCGSSDSSSPRARHAFLLAVLIELGCGFKTSCRNPCREQGNETGRGQKPPAGKAVRVVGPMAGRRESSTIRFELPLPRDPGSADSRSWFV